MELMKYFACASLAALSIVVVAAQGRGKPADGDWPMYSRDLSGTRYSPLADINTGNVAMLTQAWSRRVAEAPAGRRGAGAALDDGDGQAGGRGRGAAPDAGAAGQGRGRSGADAFGNPPGNPEATPIVVGGVMYLPAGRPRILALEADTGRLIWEHQFPRGNFTTARGVTYWPGDARNPARVFVTVGPKRGALNT